MHWRQRQRLLFGRQISIGPSPLASLPTLVHLPEITMRFHVRSTFSFGEENANACTHAHKLQ